MVRPACDSACANARAFSAPCAVALRLCQRGIGVTVIERGIPGAEASSAAAGILGPQMEAEGPGPLLELGLKSRALYPALAAELRELTSIDVGYDRRSALSRNP